MVKSPRGRFQVAIPEADSRECDRRPTLDFEQLSRVPTVEPRAAGFGTCDAHARPIDHDGRVQRNVPNHLNVRNVGGNGVLQLRLGRHGYRGPSRVSVRANVVMSVRWKDVPLAIGSGATSVRPQRA